MFFGCCHTPCLCFFRTSSAPWCYSVTLSAEMESSLQWNLLKSKLSKTQQGLQNCAWQHILISFEWIFACIMVATLASGPVWIEMEMGGLCALVYFLLTFCTFALTATGLARHMVAKTIGICTVALEQSFAASSAADSMLASRSFGQPAVLLH